MVLVHSLVADSRGERGERGDFHRRAAEPAENLAELLAARDYCAVRKNIEVFVLTALEVRASKTPR
jgi:hypothetical protein